MSRSAQLKELVHLSVSLGLVQVGYHLMGLVDTALAGRAGGETLAATGLGSSLYFTVSIFGIGIMLGLDPLIAQAVGAGRMARAHAVLLQGFYAALLVSLPMSLVLIWLGRSLTGFGISPSLAGLTYDYIIGRLPSLAPLLSCVAIRAYLQATHRTAPIIVAVVAFNIVNLVAAWLLLFGDAGLVRLGLPPLGVPSLGVSGLAWATSLATFGQFVAMAISVRKPIQECAASRTLRADGRTIVQILSVGTPLGLQLAVETGVFAVVGILMGRMGAAAMAGHQVALQLASVTYAFTLGIGSATSVQVGRAIGRGDVPGTRFAGLSGIGMGAAFMVAMATLMWVIPETLARIMTSDPEVIPLAASLVTIAAVFQVADGVQSVSSGALRGAGVTRYSFFANVLGHWLVGAPLGLYLAFGLKLGAAGLWWGLTAGLAVVALALCARFASLSRRPIARLDDGGPMALDAPLAE